MNIQTLATRLEAAALAYYSGTPTVSDAEYDALEDMLRSKDPANPVFAKIGAPVSSAWNKVRHFVDMGSLNKAQTADDFRDWFWKTFFSRRDQILFWSEKLDGISVLLVYEDGKFTQAITRGDGETGEDITRNVAIMKGVPHTVDDTDRLYVRGEIICRKSDHARHFPDESNPRNTASGTAKRQSDWRRAENLTVMAYNFSYAEDLPVNSREDEFQILENLGFTTPGHGILATIQDAETLRDNYIETTRSGLDYDIDGLVFEINSTRERVAAGSHNMRPKGAIAYKFPHDNQGTLLRGVRWQVGQTGRVTPVALFDAVGLAGAQVKQASLHNITQIGLTVTDGTEGLRTNFRVGDFILVSRRNDVIPYVERLIAPSEDGEILLPPTTCPECASSLEMNGEYLVCRNDDCPAQVVGAMRRWISKLGILHFGEHIINAACDAGMARTIADLYRLNPNDVADLVVDGRRIGGSATKAFANLHAAKEIEIHTFVGSLGIDMIGRSNTKLLVDAGFDSIEKMEKASVRKLSQVPGFGKIRAEAFRNGFDARKGLIADILAAGVKIVQPVEIKVIGSSMAGQAVCMTGFRDDAMEASIVSQGGTIASGVSKNTAILVTKDPTSTSGKAQKARELGVRILGVDEMWALLGGK